MSAPLKKLFEYIKDGNLEQVQSMVTKNKALLNEHYETSLELSISDQDQKSKGMLIKATALVVAVQEQRVPIVDWLIRQGADVNHAYMAGMAHCCDYTPLYEAVDSGNFEMVTLLLKAGANPNTFNSCLSVSPLALATQGNNLDMIKLLLSYGADINYQGNDAMGKTALMIAAENGNSEIVHYLIEHRAFPNLVDGLVGGTALVYAEQLGHDEIVLYLLEHGADPQHSG